MPDEKIENTVPTPEAPKVEVVLKPEEPLVVAPATVKKPDSADELGETIDAFFAGVQFAGLRSMKSMLAQLKEKADAVIEKLDVDSPKKPNP